MKMLSPTTFQQSQIGKIRVATPAGPIDATVIRPVCITRARPLLVLHGISRNADTLAHLFHPEADRTGRLIVVPHFTLKNWPHFQRPCRAARPDQAIIALLNHLSAQEPELAGRIDVFGHSGGAQLAHRIAMLFPQRIGTLNLGAAGWYCLPDDSMAYPYGLSMGSDPDSARWISRKQAAMDAFLRLKIRLFIGTEDTKRDGTLRQTQDLDKVQGRTRLARAHNYEQAFRRAAKATGIRSDVTLSELPGCVHDVVQAIETAGLAQRVTVASDEATMPIASVA